MVGAKELPIPARAAEDGLEVLRVFMKPDRSMELTLAPAFDDPKAWGVLLAHVARHAAIAYVKKGGHDGNDVVRAIREGLTEEWSNPNPGDRATPTKR
jgi:hypothetical protein